jgi:mannose-6-phosphate isomerase-like protein (cupin superfamily)
MNGLTMRLKGIVDKGWGSEEIWVTNDNYCSKFMHFNTGAKFSMHSHSHKEETWYVMSGKFLIRYIQTVDAQVFEYEATTGAVHHNKPLTPHQVICLEAGTILEVSTPDSIADNYRVMPGDSQNANA